MSRALVLVMSVGSKIGLDGQVLVSFSALLLQVALIACSDKISLCFSGLPDRQTFVAFTYAAMVALPQPADHCRSMFATVIRVHGLLRMAQPPRPALLSLPVSMPWLLLSDLLSLKKQASSRSQISLRLFLPRH